MGLKDFFAKLFGKQSSDSHTPQPSPSATQTMEPSATSMGSNMSDEEHNNEEMKTSEHQSVPQNTEEKH